MNLGVLTGGGDCPGLNAAIRAVARHAFAKGDSVIGIHHGWAGLLGEGDVEPLSPTSVSGILPLGGTILGTSRTNPLKSEEMMQQVFANLRRHSIEALVVIGGDDTLSVAVALHRRGVGVVGIPKTVDNDVAETDFCIGFDSAVTCVTEALDKLHSTASSHHRVMVVEVMGRDAGWVAVYGGLAGGADYIAIPEQPTDLETVCQHLKERWSSGKRFSIVVVAEGAVITGLPELEAPIDSRDDFGHARLDKRSVGETLATEVERCTGLEARTTVLGHLQRGGPPTTFDRILATRMGVAAVDYVHEGRFGQMMALKGKEIVPVPLEKVAGRSRKVDLSLLRTAGIFF